MMTAAMRQLGVLLRLLERARVKHDRLAEILLMARLRRFPR